MIYLHKILPALLSPLMLVLVLLGFTLWRRCRVATLIALLILLLASLPIVSFPLFRLVENNAVRQPITAMQSADAIVVLSGMLTDVRGVDGVVSEWSDADRFFAGVDLYKAGKAPLLVFTGGRMPWTLSERSEGDQLANKAHELGVPQTALRVTGDVENTADEAQAVAKLLGAGSHRMILVTSAFHMPRAQFLFEREGITVHPYAVDFKTEAAAPTPMDYLPSVRALALTDIALRELIGRLYYRLIKG